MKIMKFDEFAAMPVGTIYSYYEPIRCEGLYRKGKTCVWDDAPRDFFTASLIASNYNGTIQFDDMEGRWGLFEYDQLFLVYEECELVVMRTMLSGPAGPERCTS